MTKQSDKGSTSGFTEEQQRRVVELVEYVLAKDDVKSCLADVAQAFRLALEATSEDFERWREEVERTGFSDEFGLSPHEVESQTPEGRLAYLSQLLRTAALAYDESIAGLVKGLVDIADGLPVQRPSPPGADESPEARALRFEMLRKLYGHEEADE